MQNPLIKTALFAADDAEAVAFAASLQRGFGTRVLVHGCTLAAFQAAGVKAEPVDAGISAENALVGVDLVVSMVPDFNEALMSGASFPKCVSSIELSRVALIRAAAKRFAEVAVVIDENDFAAILQELSDNDGATLYETRIRQAHAAFQAISDYDYDVAEWLAAKLGISQ